MQKKDFLNTKCQNIYFSKIYHSQCFIFSKTDISYEILFNALNHKILPYIPYSKINTYLLD